MDSKDIMYMFSTVPPVLWLQVLLSYIAFIAILWFGHRLLDKHKRSDSIWMVTIAFLGQDNFPEDRKYVSLLSLIMCTGRERKFREQLPRVFTEVFTAEITLAKDNTQYFPKHMHRFIFRHVIPDQSDYD